jgi:hypothetical protein
MSKWPAGLPKNRSARIPFPSLFPCCFFLEREGSLFLPNPPVRRPISDGNAPGLISFGDQDDHPGSFPLPAASSIGTAVTGHPSGDSQDPNFLRYWAVPALHCHGLCPCGRCGLRYSPHFKRDAVSRGVGGRKRQAPSSRHMHLPSRNVIPEKRQSWVVGSCDGANPSVSSIKQESG